MRKRRPSGPVEPLGGDMFALNFSEQDRITMTGFVDQLEDLLSTGTDDPRVRRLYPVAYHDDPERDAEYQHFMHDELRRSRATSIATVREVLATEEPLTRAQIHGFMIVVNSLRLVLGTLLDVDESTDTDEIDTDDPLHGQAQLYGYLGWLLEWTVAALSGE